MYRQTRSRFVERIDSSSNREQKTAKRSSSIMSDFIDALNLITSTKIHELYAKQDTEDPLVLRKKVRQTERRTDRDRARAGGEQHAVEVLLARVL